MKRYFYRPILELIFVFGLAALIGGCGSSGELTVANIRARSAASGQNGAVYFVVDNQTQQDDILLEARGDVAETIEIHLSSMDENSVMSMQQQASVSIPARSTVEFKPGGLHIMLINLKNELQTGDIFEITLVFQNAGEIVLNIPVTDQP
jgi:copper(I)-binding protein